MASIDQIVTRWVRDVRTDSPRYLSDHASNVKVREDRLYSYGRHFELARWVKPQGTGLAEHGFWLLNGDTFSVSTSRHQRAVRDEVQSTGLPVLILPHRTLRAAGIDLDSIAPLDITKDREIPVPRTYPADAIPERLTRYYGTREYMLDNGYLTDNGDGTFTHNATRHVLGEALFTADYRQDDRTARVSFLSAFDHQERHLHYFLAQLPPTDATTVEQAFAALRPLTVKWADSNDVAVTRQGDIFAVPHITLSTRALTTLGGTIEKQGRLLGTSHTASEVITLADGRTFARGTLTHRPEVDAWGRARLAEHRRQKMSDGKTWHLIVKNTVPQDAHGNNRAWSPVGNVD